MKRLAFLLVTIMMVLLVFTGCDIAPTADRVQQDLTKEKQAEQQAIIGMPSVPNNAEKRWVKEIIEARDDVDAVMYVYTYVPMTGKHAFMTLSLGYGVPYSTQYTNPAYIAATYGNGGGAAILPQADPNGLWTAGSVDATWLMGLDIAEFIESNGESVKTAPIYAEPQIFVYPYKLPAEYLEWVPSFYGAL